MKEVHINSPIFNGDRSQMFVGIAYFRLLNKSKSLSSGDIRIWIDYKERDGEGNYKMLYPFPFQMSCKQVTSFPTQVLNDRNRTVLHIVPISALRLVKKYRSGSPRGRTMPQSEFSQVKQDAIKVAEKQRMEEPKENKVEQGKLL